MSITVPRKKEGKHMTVLNMVLVCLLHARIQEFLPGGGMREALAHLAEKAPLSEKKTLTVLQRGSDFFLFDSLHPYNNLLVIYT